MSTHLDLVNIRIKLGYKPSKGLCFGLSLRWLEACLVGEERKFNFRITKIILNSLIPLINIDKSELFDIRAFFDSVSLFHYPHIYSLYGSTRRYQHDFELNSSFASSDKINEAGGLAKIYVQSFIYTDMELKAYLDDLSSVFERACSEPSDIVGMLLAGHSHAMSLTYQKGMGWCFMDINQYPSKKFKVEETDLLVEAINAGFIKTQYFLISVKIISTKYSPFLPKLIDELEVFKQERLITEEMIRREEEGCGLIYRAVVAGDIDTVEALIKFGVDPNQIDKDGNSLIFTALTSNNHVGVIKALAEGGADLNRIVKGKNPPALVAVLNANVLALEVLAQYGADLHFRDNGRSLAFLAALHGYAGIILELKKYNVDINVPCTYNFWRLKRDLTQVKRILRLYDWRLMVRADEFLAQHLINAKTLIEQFIFLITSFFEITPLEIALIGGHDDAVQALCKLELYSYFTEWYSKIGQFSDGQDALSQLNTALVSVSDAINNQLNIIKNKKSDIELKIKETEEIIYRLRDNNEKVRDRAYFLDFIAKYNEQYALVMNNTIGADKDSLIAKVAGLRDSGPSASILYGMSRATSFCTVVYRSVTPNALQKSIASFFPDTVDSACKDQFNRLAIKYLNTLKQELAAINQELYRQLPDMPEDKKQFLDHLSAESFTDILNELRLFHSNQCKGLKPMGAPAGAVSALGVFAAGVYGRDKYLPSDESHHYVLQ